jgi:hypothetical protein
MPRPSLKVIIIALIAGPWLLAQTGVFSGIQRWYAGLGDVHSIFELSPGDIKSQLKKITRALPEIERHIAQGRYQAARELFDQRFYLLRGAQQKQANPELAAGTKFRAELDELEARVARAARQEFDRLVGTLSQGGPDTAAMQQLISCLSPLGGQNLGAEYAARAPELDRTRRRLATRWVRLNITARDEAYATIVAQHFARTVRLPDGYTLVHGPPVGPAEAAATFATFDIKVTLHEQQYVETRADDWSTNHFQHGTPAGGLLDQVRAEVQQTCTAGDYVTFSHRTLPPVRPDHVVVADVPAPASFTVRNRENIPEEFRRRNRERGAELQQKLQVELAKLPVFDLAPPVTAATSPFSRERALRDPAGFVRDATAALQRGENVGRIACVAVGLSFDVLAPSIEGRLDQLTAEERFSLGTALKARPWYHEYEMVTQLLARTPPEESTLLLEALQNDLHQAAIRELVLRRILESRMHRDSTAWGILVETLQKFPAEARAACFATLDSLPPEQSDALLAALFKAERPVTARHMLEKARAGGAEVAATMARVLELGLRNAGGALQPDELAIFLHAVNTSAGPARIEVINHLPTRKELFEELWRLDLAAWSGAEAVALYESSHSIAWPIERLGTILEDLLARHHAGGFATRELSQMASLAYGAASNEIFLRHEHDEFKLTLALRIIDRTPTDSQWRDMHGTSVRALLGKVEASWLAAHPDIARPLLTAGRKHPVPRVRERVEALIAATPQLGL